MTIQAGTPAPLLDAQDEQGNMVMLPALERWTHLWFNPIFGRYGCKECQASLIHELYPDLRMDGCFPYGATYDSPEVNARRNAPHVWRIPLLQISQETAAEWGALRDEADPWFPHAPASVAYLIDPMGVVQVAFTSVNHRVHAKEIRTKLAELKAGVS